MNRRLPLQANSALAEMMARDAEREGRPFGGWAGEMATPAREPTTSAPTRPAIPRPPWAEGGEPEPEGDPPEESAA